LTRWRRTLDHGKKAYRPEEIVAKLRQVEVLQSQGTTVADAVRQIGVTEMTYYRWQREYGGMKTDQLKLLKELEKENQRLRRAVSDLTLDKLILAEAAKGNFEPFASPPLHRASAEHHRCDRAPGLPNTRSASLHAARGSRRSR